MQWCIIITQRVVVTVTVEKFNAKPPFDNGVIILHHAGVASQLCTIPSLSGGSQVQIGSGCKSTLGFNSSVPCQLECNDGYYPDPSKNDGLVLCDPQVYFRHAQYGKPYD
jgi:hypothetical protein